jgi:undecaprenyl-diphosphatase
MSKTAFGLDSFVRFLESGDHKVMLRVNGWRPPRWIRVWVLCATRGGDGWLWSSLGALILVFGGAARFFALAAAMIAAGAGIALFLWLKRRFRRRRPCAIQPICWHELLPPDQFSFPSGHTITAFAVAATVSHFYPGMEVGLIFCAVSVAISRVLLGMHYVSDVIAGGLLGGALAYSSVHLVSWALSSPV